MDRYDMQNIMELVAFAPELLRELSPVLRELGAELQPLMDDFIIRQAKRYGAAMQACLANGFSREEAMMLIKPKSSFLPVPLGAANRRKA